MANKYIKPKQEPTGIISIRATNARVSRWKNISERVNNLRMDRRAFNEAVGTGLDKMMDEAERELDEIERTDISVNGAMRHAQTVS